MFSVKDLASDLSTLGLKNGDTVLVHSSYKSVGETDGGAMGIINALIEAVGENGTVIFPALSYNPVYETKVFEPDKTPSCVGYLSEVFRTADGVKRSMHPTHSCAVFGRESRYILEGHHRDITPVGQNSPFAKLPIIGGKILMLGCGFSPMTSMHGVEETVGRMFLADELTEYSIIDEGGSTRKMSVHRHSFHTQHLEQRYDRLENVLSDDAYSTGMVGNAKTHLIDASRLWHQAHRIMQNDSMYFVEKK